MRRAVVEGGGGHVGIDFGITTTVVAVVDPLMEQRHRLRLIRCRVVHHDDSDSHSIPSLIHFDSSGGHLLGRAVEDRNLIESNATFRWMKPTIVEQLYDGPRPIGGRTLTQRQAAEEFLAAVFTQLQKAGFTKSRVCFTVPVHSFEEYVDWISDTATKNGFDDITFADEPSAAGAGYDVGLNVGDHFLLFDFGGGTLDVAIIELLEPTGAAKQRVRVLGKGGVALGGRCIDRWIAEWAQSELDDTTLERLRNVCSFQPSAQNHLVEQTQAIVDVIDPMTEKSSFLTLTNEHEQILDDNRMFDVIEDTLRAALNQAKDHNVGDSDLKGVLLVGGSSLIPAVRRHLSRRFGSNRVHLHKPIDAVAIGAARIASGAQIDNRLYHEYQLRYRENGRYAYEPIVAAGSPHPTDGWIENLIVTSTATGQSRFELELFETDVTRVKASGCEIFFDNDGKARFGDGNADTDSYRRHICSESLEAKPSKAPERPSRSASSRRRPPSRTTHRPANPK